VPVTPVRVSAEPSPKSTVSDWICRAVDPVAVVATVIDTGTPSVPVSGAVMETGGAAVTVTVTSFVAVPAVAVTFDVDVVCSVVRATPAESESADVELS